MAKKIDKKKIAKAKPIAKPLKKASKPAPKKVAAKPIKKISKPAPKPATKKVTAKPVAKKIEKKLTKPAPKKATKPVDKKKDVSINKATAKNPVKPLTKKPIDAVATKTAKTSKKKVKVGKKGKKSDDDDEDDLPAEEEDDSDVDVKDDYEKTDDDDIVADVELDEAGLVDLEGGGAPEIDEDDDEIPEKRGRGRRKKNDGKSSGGSMEAYIRNRPLQIDINKPLIKKSSEVIPTPFVNTDDKRSRYTDKELAEFKELILSKLKEAQTDYDLLKQTLSNEDDHGTDDTSPTFKLLEDGSDVMSKEETAQLAQRQEKYIVNLKNALVRIENKTYGICRVTGKLIPKERLRSVPHATLGIDAKLNQTN